MLGEGDGTATPDEIAWAFRKLLEGKAAQEPLLCIFDDIQWGEETFLDLIEHSPIFRAALPSFSSAWRVRNCSIAGRPGPAAS